MAMSRTLHLGLLFALLCAAISSCISPPDYSDTPRIKFKKLDVVRLPSAPGEQPFDSDTITISFEDGDGDLGLNPEDNMAPYNDASVNGKQTNPNYFNYYIQAQLKNPSTNQFEDYIIPGSNGEVGQYNGRFPRLTTESTKEGPLKGNLRYNLGLYLESPFKAGDEIRFRISIRDRALNLSNEIFTDSYVVKP
ncbi:hypothetical protein [Hymenobacter volaticus]|uniref:DUF3823 domain-containing protein n=1 Tax=Hymenobacter volaticus TaxID=2932254 RepID=A0ABY4GA38_9BACT|nr:hypothetical protein [Hymenobacter volaticus]UOQ67768.1 hypothetical protein MUN86_07875 [Hymenobacter volaticus]